MRVRVLLASLITLLIVLITPAIIAFADVMTWFYTGHNLSGFVWGFERVFVVVFLSALSIPVVAFTLITIDC